MTRVPATRGKRRRKCKYGDPLCPCQDGDMCHYEGPNPMPPPEVLPSRKKKDSK